MTLEPDEAEPAITTAQLRTKLAKVSLPGIVVAFQSIYPKVLFLPRLPLQMYRRLAGLMPDITLALNQEVSHRSSASHPARSSVLMMLLSPSNLPSISYQVRKLHSATETK